MEEIDVFPRATQRIDLSIQKTHALIVKMVTPEGEPLPKAMAEAGLDWQLEVIAVATREPPSGHLPMTDRASHASVVHQSDGELSASADLARVTLARMSLALAVHMNGFGSKLCSSM